MENNIKSFQQIYCLRVSQLDAKLLSNELFSTIESQLSEIQIAKLRDLTPELLALIKWYVCKHTIQRSGISIGQSILGLKYYNFSSNHCIKQLNSNQIVSYALTQILFPWIKQRINFVTKDQTIRNAIDFVENLYKSLNFMNCLIFLYCGKYASLWERLCKITVGLQSINQKRNNSELYVEIMTRELLWNSFAEFLTFVLPLINFYRIKNTFNYFLRTLVVRPNHEIDSKVEQRTVNDLKICGICNEWPIDGHDIGCRHVFCYYCLMSNFMSDESNGFTCNQCFYKMSSIYSIKKVKPFIL